MAAGLGPGVAIGGFEIERELKTGGMGRVFLARQRSVGREVALKVLPPEIIVDPAAVARFLGEARTGAQLEHPNLVTVYDAGVDHGVHYLAMQLVRGRSLAERLQLEGPLAEDEALAIVDQVAAALEHAWDRLQVCHRDVKPENILLDEQNRPRLIDLGLFLSAGSPGRQTEAGMLMGTPNYMSPEQIDGVPDLDFRTDVYALGATLYHAVTGRLPFEAATLVKTLQLVATETLPDPRTLRPGLSRGLVELVRTMMARERGLRHASWQAVRADMAAVRAGRRPASKPVPPGQSAVAVGTRLPRKASAPAPAPAAALRLVEDAPTVVRLPPGGAPEPATPTRRVVVRHTVRRPVPSASAAPSPLHPAAASATAHPQTPELPAAPETPAEAHVHVPTPRRPRRAARLAWPAVLVVVAAVAGGVLGVRALLVRQMRHQDRLIQDAHARRVEAFEQRLREIQAGPLRSAGDYREAGRALAALALEARGTRVSAQADAEAARLRAGLDAAVASAWTALKARADAALQAGDAPAALRTLFDYAGPYSEELGSRRREYGLTVQRREEQRAADARRREEEAARRGRYAVQALVRDMAGALAANETARAQGLYAEAVAAGECAQAGPEWESVHAQVRAALGVEAAIRDSYQSDVGKDVHMILPEGQVSARIDGVDDQSVRVRVRRGTAWVGMTLALKDLPSAERFRRAGDDSRDGRLRRAVVAVEAGALASAERELAAASGALAKALRSRVADRLRNRELADRRGAAAAEEARLAADYAELMREAGVEPSARGAKVDVASLRSEGYSGLSLQRLQRLARAFEERNGSSPLYARYEPAVRAIERLRAGQAMGADMDGLRAGLAQLRQDNPEMVTDAQLSIEGDQVRVVINGDPGVVSIAALEGMPINDLRLVRLRVSNLAPLAGMPLRRLELSGCHEVQSLAPLRGLDLADLAVDSPSVTDISPLRGMPLRRLRLLCPGVRDLRALQGMPLQELSLACPQVGDFSPLQGMPLTYLDAPGTQVRALEPLAGMPLTHLNVAGSAVSNLSPLRGMPLLTLNLDRTRVKSLDDLKDLPLRALSIIGLDIRDLSPVANVPSVTRVAGR